jgi:hypothetical protein
MHGRLGGYCIHPVFFFRCRLPFRRQRSRTRKCHCRARTVMVPSHPQAATHTHLGNSRARRRLTLLARARSAGSCVAAHVAGERNFTPIHVRCVRLRFRRGSLSRRGCCLPPRRPGSVGLLLQNEISTAALPPKRMFQSLAKSHISVFLEPSSRNTQRPDTVRVSYACPREEVSPAWWCERGLEAGKKHTPRVCRKKKKKSTWAWCAVAIYSGLLSTRYIKRKKTFTFHRLH